MSSNLHPRFSRTILLGAVVLCTSLVVSPNLHGEAAGQPKPPAQPKAPAKPKPQAKPPAPSGGLDEFLKKFDLDKNKIINVEEAMAIQSAYKSNPQDPMLKKYDTDKNAELSDAEIMKISPAKPTPPKPKAAKPAPAKPKNPKKK